MASAPFDWNFTRLESRIISFLAIFGPSGVMVTTVIYNTTGRWWPMVVYGGLYVPMMLGFMGHVARTRQVPLRWFFRSKKRRGAPMSSNK